MKRAIYIFLIISLSSLFYSCSDWFDIYPKSETIVEDFWKDESDVLSMVGSCYRGMNEEGFIKRMITWGELRSDNVINGRELNDMNLIRIFLVDLNSSNSYAYWGEIYSVINYCNTVIHFAPGVKDKDPNFTEGQLRAYIAEVKGIRALCYFYLLRTFRDVPLITEPFVDNTKSFEVPQKNPTELLDFLIDDLKSIEKHAVVERENKMYNKGRITQNAVWALLADMYLWKNDYQHCIDYCDSILVKSSNKLKLENSKVYNQSLYVIGNSDESIFELQFSLNNVANKGLYSMYGNPNRNNEDGQLSAFNFSKYTLFGEKDLRGKDAFFPNASGTFLPIKKYAAWRVENTTSDKVQASDYWNVQGAPNWIFYRLADIYLMKAEALVEIGNNLEEALNLVSKIYDRANPDLGTGSLQLSSYNSQALMRELVFDERQREFIFEGKRYFDLMRRIHREGSALSIVNTYLMRKYEFLEQSSVRSKLTDLNALYMPIHVDELKSNTLLKQNPFYVLSADIEKN